MSAEAISFSTRARSFGLERSALTLFLLRLNSGKKPAPEPISVRVLSPPGGSTLITSAPKSPRIMPQVGPITMWVNSTTRIPLSGRRAPLPVDLRGVLARDLVRNLARGFLAAVFFGAFLVAAFAALTVFFFAAF